MRASTISRPRGSQPFVDAGKNHGVGQGQTGNPGFRKHRLKSQAFRIRILRFTIVTAAIYRFQRANASAYFVPRPIQPAKRPS